MDLSRWSLRHLGHLLGNVLDAEPPAGADEIRDDFDVSDEFDELDRSLALLRVGSEPERVLAEFAPYFEGGLSLRVSGDECVMTSLFLFGQTFTPEEPMPQTFGLRQLDLLSVLKMSAEPLLRALKLGPFFRLDGAAAFAFAPSRNAVFILFDNRPHPWQVFAIENAYLSARDAFSRGAGRAR